MINIIKSIDPRYIVFGHHLLLIIAAKQLLNLQRTWAQIFFGLAIAIIVELALYYTTTKYKNTKVSDRVVSAATEAVGLIVLINSQYFWFYGVMIATSIFAKYLLLNNGRHIFNPTNFAIVLSLAVLPLTSFKFYPDEYSTHLYPVLHVLVFGIWATVLANRWMVSLGFFVLSGFSSLILSKGHIMELMYYFGTDFGTLALIFIFLMITDPKTTPSKRSHQFIFGGSVALMHHFLKTQEVLYSYFLALYIVTILNNLRLKLSELNISMLKKTT